MLVFISGFLLGGFLTIIWAILLFYTVAPMRDWLRRYVDEKDGIEFRAMPDRGLDELLYKPRDGETEISKGVLGRRKKQS